MTRRLYRSNVNRMIAGVCGGMAEYLGIDPTVVRLGFVLLTFASGIGILLYVVMAVIVPRAPVGASPPVASAAPVDLSWLGPAILLLVGLGLVVFGMTWALDQVGLRFWMAWSFWNMVRALAGFFWSMLLIVIGLVIIAASLRRR
jgi:phage shock protein C